MKGMGPFLECFEYNVPENPRRALVWSVLMLSQLNDEVSFEHNVISFPHSQPHDQDAHPSCTKKLWLIFLSSACLPSSDHFLPAVGLGQPKFVMFAASGNENDFNLCR